MTRDQAEQMLALCALGHGGEARYCGLCFAAQKEVPGYAAVTIAPGGGACCAHCQKAHRLFYHGARRGRMFSAKRPALPMVGATGQTP